ncbi:MAG TPA: hypothetical protein VLX59_08295 [Acidimicrobiales bacterium]|nr:hypothetical protein [Acidimicrobiales bacterium]
MPEDSLHGTSGRTRSTTDGKGSAETIDRRKILEAALGVAGAGVVGGSVLAGASATPAAAETTEQGALAPAVVNLTDAPTIAVDASLGNDFRVTIAANRTMGNPTNSTDGEQIILQITQGPGGPFAMSWGDGYMFSSGLPQPSLSAGTGQTDLFGFIYDAATGKWLLAAFVDGFS